MPSWLAGGESVDVDCIDGGGDRRFALLAAMPSLGFSLVVPEALIAAFFFTGTPALPTVRGRNMDQLVIDRCVRKTGPYENSRKTKGRFSFTLEDE